MDDRSTVIGKYAALLSAIEIGLGSLLHSLHVPFAGHFLSLNQGLILTKVSLNLQDKKAAGLVSTTTALLKSLSPAGKKLTPMLAIAMQGQCFGLGCFLLGTNLLGHILGMTLLSLWGFIQGAAVFLIIFGNELEALSDFYLKQIQEVFPISATELLGVLLMVVLAKIILGIMLVFLAHFLNPKWEEYYGRWAKSRPVPTMNPTTGNVFMAAGKDMLTPFFVFSWFLVAVFFFYSQSEHTKLIWGLLRPLAIGYVLFLVIRLFPIEKLVTLLEKKHPNLAKSLQAALKYLK